MFMEKLGCPLSPKKSIVPKKVKIGDFPVLYSYPDVGKDLPATPHYMT